MNFQKLGEVEYLNEVPKDANLFVEYGGKVKRAPAKLGSNFASFDILPLLMNMNTNSEIPMVECSLQEAYSYINKVKESDGVILYVNVPEDMADSSGLPINFIKAQTPIILGGVAKDESSGEVMMEGVAGVIPLGSTGVVLVVVASPAEGRGMIGIISDF